MCVFFKIFSLLIMGRCYQVKNDFSRNDKRLIVVLLLEYDVIFLRYVEKTKVMSV